jgi:hypothetical protein
VLSEDARKALELAKHVRLFKGTMTLKSALAFFQVRGIMTRANTFYRRERGLAQGLARFYREVDRVLGKDEADHIALAFTGQHGTYCY